MRKLFVLLNFVLAVPICGVAVDAGIDPGVAASEVPKVACCKEAVPNDTRIEDREYSTELLSGDSDTDIQRAIELLKAGELVAVPTETVYGLGANAADPEAVMKIFHAKQRPLNHPFIIHIASFEDVPKWAKDVPERARKLADAFWPGPLTMELHRADGVNMVVTGGHDKVALRCPSDPVFSKILTLGNIGVAAPSANLHKKISTTTAEHVMKALKGCIAAVVAGGDSSFGTESTIIDLKPDVPRILRPGPITRQEIEAVLGEPVEAFHADEETASPGSMKIHYQPTTKASLMTIDAIKNCIAQNPTMRFVVIHYSDFECADQARCQVLKLSKNKRLYAHDMYTAMHCADEKGCDQILIEEPPVAHEWEDVHDRLAKATAVL